jgi:hypothetical protein
MTVKQSNLKEQVMNFKTKCFGAVADPRHLGVHILTKVIPSMDINGDVAFAWLWAKNDLGVYNQKEYDGETKMYVETHKMKKTNGDTEWVYEFKNKDGKMRKATITTEIWYKEGEDHRTSPVAMLLNQFFGAGLHIAKVKFSDVA